MCDTTGRLVLVGDPAPEQVPDVRRERPHLPLLSVQGEREELPVVHPEILVEPLPEIVGLPLEPVREPVVAPDLAGEPRAADLRVVDVSLELARRSRKRGERAVREEDRVPGVLPALVLEAGLRVAALVLDVAVAVPVAVLVDPFERSPGVLLELSHESTALRPALVLVEQDQEQHRRVGAPVVGRMRALLERGELAAPKLVQDLPGLLVTELV